MWHCQPERTSQTQENQSFCQVLIECWYHIDRWQWAYLESRGKHLRQEESNCQIHHILYSNTASVSMHFNASLQGSSSWDARCLLNLLEVSQNARWAHEEGWKQEPAWHISNLHGKYYTGNVFGHLHDDICWQIVCTHKFHNPILNRDVVLQTEIENIWVILEGKWGKNRHHLQSVVGGKEITGSV